MPISPKLFCGHRMKPGSSEIARLESYDSTVLSTETQERSILTHSNIIKIAMEAEPNAMEREQKF